MVITYYIFKKKEIKLPQVNLWDIFKRNVPQRKNFTNCDTFEYKNSS